LAVATTITDTLTLSDAPAMAEAFSRSLADTLNLSDAVAKAVGMGRSDTLSLSDALARAFGLARADTLSLSDLAAYDEGALAAPSTVSRGGFFCSQATLETGEASKTVQATPGPGRYLHVTALYVTVLVAPGVGVTVDIEDSGGSVHLMRLSSGAAVNNMFQLVLRGMKRPRAGQGLRLPADTGLVITPSEAGPSVHVITEGFILPV
jgi:hypothetical protein